MLFPPFVAPLLAVSILLAYVAALWWLLRREGAPTLLWLAALTAVCLVLRLVYTGDYPAGFNEDEVKVLGCTIHFLRIGALLAEDCIGLPGLVSILFEAQLAEIIGPTAWAVRGYSMLGSVLAVPAGFAAARSLGLRRASSLAFAGFLAVLPWSILYGRVHQSGDMLLHEMLIVAALGRFLASSGGLPEIAMGAMSLCLLFYGYFSGRALLYLTLFAAGLARGRYRFFCLAIPLIALVGWYPYIHYSHSPHVFTGLSGLQVQEQYEEKPLETLVQKTTQALHALVAPVAFDQWLTIRTGAMHPYLLLGLALIGGIGGFFSSGRRTIFLWAAFFLGLSPAVVGHSPLPSTRRMLMALPFIALAAAAALDLVPWRRWRATLAAAAVIVIGVQSVLFYFSDEFWPPNSRWMWDAQRSRLVDAIPMPPHPRLIVSSGIGFFFSPRAMYDQDVEGLHIDNWIPEDGQEAIYAFTPGFGPLRSLYEEVFGEAHVQHFDNAFIVHVDAEEHSRLRDHGWRYDWACEGVESRRTQVPALFHVAIGFHESRCYTTAYHEWHARWTAPPAKLRFRFSGTAEIDTPREQIRAEGFEEQREFAVETGDELRLGLEVPQGLEILAVLQEVTPQGERVPSFASLDPLPAMDAAAPSP